MATEARLDIPALDQFGKSLRKLSDQGLRGRTGGLSKTQLRGFWNRAATAVKAEAVKSAPASGKTGATYWSKKARTGGNTFRYEGKHGWFKQRGSIRHRAWKTGAGVTLTLAGKSKSVEQGYTVVVGKFATWSVRRIAGGRAKKGNPNPWLIHGINKVGPSTGKQYVKLISDSLQTEIQKGQTRR